MIILQIDQLPSCPKLYNLAKRSLIKVEMSNDALIYTLGRSSHAPLDFLCLFWW